MYLSGLRMLVVEVGACSPGSFECFRPPWEVLSRKINKAVLAWRNSL